MKNFYQYLVEIDAWNGLAIETVRLSGHPPSTIDSLEYLSDPGLIRVEMFQGSKTYGLSTYSFGEIVVNNFAEHAIGDTDGPLDYLKAYSFDGRAVRVYQGNDGDAYGALVLVIDAVAISATFDWNKISFAIKSKQVELDIPVDGGTFWTYEVVLQEQGEGGVPTGVTTMTATVPIAQATQYSQEVGAVPGYTVPVTAIGFLQFDGVDQVGDANKYGIDIEFESVDASEEWDVLSYTALT